MSDPYLDPQFGILRNRFGLTDQESLDRAEADVVAVRSILLQSNPLKGNFDSEHLKQIPLHLFRDVYEWAGQFRTVPLAKADYTYGGRVTRFTPPELIEQELTAVFENLAREGFLKGLPRKDFARNTAVLFSEINRIHPFREGNGRAQRQFVIIYLTDGPNKEVPIGRRSIYFKHARPKAMAGLDGKFALVVQALRHLRKQAVVAREIETLRGALSAVEKRKLVKDTQFGVDWIYEVAKKIAEKTARTRSRRRLCVCF